MAKGRKQSESHTKKKARVLTHPGRGEGRGKPKSTFFDLEITPVSTEITSRKADGH